MQKLQFPADGQLTSAELRAALIAYAGQPEASFEPIDLGRPIFIFAPDTMYGRERLGALRRAMPNIVAAVDGLLPGASIRGIPLWRPGEVACRLGDFVRPLAISFAYDTYAKRFFENFCRDIGLECVDFVAALRQADSPAIFVPPAALRRSIVERLDEYLAIVDRLEDEESKESLLAALLFRVTYDRDILARYITSLESEYFSYGPGRYGETFRLGTSERFVDVGANVGQTIRRFLAATDWRFDRIDSFEPDSANFADLRTMVSALRLPNIHIHELALSDQSGTLSFHEGFATGSRLGDGGNSTVRTETLDRCISDATFIKMDTEGHEAKILQGAAGLIKRDKPRLAITTYHNPDDLLDIFSVIDQMDAGYRYRFRHHRNYYYDGILYASQSGTW